MDALSSHRSSPSLPTLKEILNRPLLFVEGKGGVGKTVLAQSIAHALAAKNRSTLLVSIENPLLPAGELKKIASNLWHLNCDPTTAFEEYASLKIGVAALTRIFLQNKLMRYLGKAAPGVHEVVILGKIWHDRKDYDHVVVDMPSMGYGITMFQSTANFAKLFRGGPIHRDSEAMLKTFADPAQTGQLIVSLAEEMPLTESLELRDYLNGFFPDNAPGFLVNRRFPKPEILEDSDVGSNESSRDYEKGHTPLATSALDYLTQRFLLEDHNMRLWRNQKIPYGEIGYIPPAARSSGDVKSEPAIQKTISRVSALLAEKGYV
ncbi:MAG: hypothetical protein H7222_13425 [Methylotenera sp.]|nr:hypothetical protein [Oligoflexia bacterium]